MKQISQSISNSTKSLPGRWTKVTTLGCILALVFLGATSAQPKAKGTARPFKEKGLITFNLDGTTFGVVGNATHLGKFVGKGTYEVIPPYDKIPAIIHFHVAATWTAANGDTIDIDMPDWVSDHSVNPPTSTGVVNIIGGTGRFVNASGSFYSEISPPRVSPDVVNIITGEGTISY